MMCIILSSKSKQGKTRQRLTTLFGLFLVACSFSRLLSILCIWHNYAILDGWVKIFTGVIALFAIAYMPRAIKEAMEQRALEETTAILQKTKEDLHEVRKLSEKIDNK